ncbi:M48 family metallopeptidase [Brevibacillus sp. WF146]|uniref:M48 family metallopeptidase n=1 Tax=Brevibacillus sp. WF146 TaxID=319501 RepID=UPI0007ED2F1D|nr:SprT family zinc-dependent metalloprotease [Brevibacillus sp. WF146]UYZ14760.1 M48 family metallopeptidase [Brevibacillus sp. WF146]
MQIQQVEFGGKVIPFVLVRKPVKHVNLHIKPDMTVMVSANEKVPLDFILGFVKQKAAWILKNIQFFEDVQPEVQSEKEYVSGESFKYLGKQYRLRVEESESEGVKYYRGFIYLYVKDELDFKRKEKLFGEWLRNRAETVFNESLDKMYALVQKYNVRKPKLIIRTMKARWGSCLSDAHAILLNFELIKAPKYCIDYVVLHELIHFLYKNHDYQFYSFLSALMPDWKQRKAILDEEIVREL